MSTLSIPTTRVPSDVAADVDTRFDALVRSVVPGQRGPADVDFETVFDLDYGQPVDAPVARVRQLRQTQPEPRKAAPRTVRLTRRGRIVLLLGFLTLALA